MADERASQRSGRGWARPAEGAGIFVLGLLAVYFLRESWRKWPDPIIDSGPQWYAVWRVSLGAIPSHAFAWNYGPLSVCFNALLFRCFGPGMMVLAVANLIIYAVLAVLAYVVFRQAWGPLAAFVALGVFISVFSFSMLNVVGNYNYVLPYASETTHGMLLLFLTALAAVRWMRGKSWRAAFLLGFCGGVAAVLKPEFMLAGGLLGMLAIFLRHRAGEPVRLGEWALIAGGIILPTLFFVAWFGRQEGLVSAFWDATRAWSVLFHHDSGDGPSEASYLGYDFGGRNVGFELEAGLTAILAVGAIWACGWFLNRPWRPLLRWVAALAAGFLACSVDMGGGFEVGPCFPGLILIALVLEARDVWRQKPPKERELMGLALAVLAAAMLVRMGLRARINHFGYYQASLAGMVIAAMLVLKVPRWTGRGVLGRSVATAGILALLAACCASVVAESNQNHVNQTQSVGVGRDRFLAFQPRVDDTGATVDWCAREMSQLPSGAQLLVLPEGVMINYLSRHERPMFEYDTNTVESDYVKQMAGAAPDCVIVIWGDQRDGGTPRFGDPGFPGHLIVQWLRENYVLTNTHRERIRWSFVFRRKEKS